MSIRCLLWDFGDTLCDERFIWGAGPEWMQLYESFDDGWGDRWSAGEIDLAAFAERAAPVVGMPPAEVIDFMRTRSRGIQWFVRTFDFFKRRHLPQAIVTVNPDFFSEVIVPMHDLTAYCDTIVVSYEHRTNDKGILCQKAIDELGWSPGESVLIDNKKANTDRWQGCGGRGYHYRDDASFALDVENGIDGLSFE